MVLQLKLTLLEAEPLIWRRILVDDSTTLHQLHRMIQILMGWWDYHLYQFTVGGVRYSGPDDEPFLDEGIGQDASTVTLRKLGLKKGGSFEYEYDFGDSWHLAVVVERRRQDAGRRWVLPWLLEGERAGPPEDCGGIHGLERILAALEGDPPDDDDEQERLELLEWLGDYDPTGFARRTVNHFLVLAAAWGLLDG